MTSPTEPTLETTTEEIVDIPLEEIDLDDTTYCSERIYGAG